MELWVMRGDFSSSKTTVRKTIPKLAKRAGLLPHESSELPQASDGLVSLGPCPLTCGKQALKMESGLHHHQLPGPHQGWA